MAHEDGPSAAAPSPGAAEFSARATGALVLADGTVFEGQAFGAPHTAVGEVCFNTAMTGYQEILADPSYAGQIVAFTFPHIGIVGANEEDIESITPAVRGAHRARPCRDAVQLSRRHHARPLAEAAQHSRAFAASTRGRLTARIREKRHAAWRDRA